MLGFVIVCVGFCKKRPSVFQSGCASLHSDQQCLCYCFSLPSLRLVVLFL